MKSYRIYLSLIVTMGILFISGCGTMRGVLADGGQAACHIAGGEVEGLPGLAVNQWICPQTKVAINQFFDYLDEQEKQQALRAARESLKSQGKAVSWKGKNGVEGIATASAMSRDGCQKVDHLVVKNGKQFTTKTLLCKDPKTGQMLPAEA